MSDILKLAFEVVLNHQFYINQFNIAMVRISINGRKKLVDVCSKEFENWLQYSLLKQGILLEGKYFTMILKATIAKATNEGKKIETFQRTARKDGAIYYDLNNDASQVVKVDEEGFTVEENGAKVPFLQNASMREQVKPNMKAKVADIHRLKNYVTLNPSDYTLFLILLCTSMIADISHPILILNGSQGSLKSTLTRIFKNIVDPTMVEISAMPSKMESIILQFLQEYAVCYDNLVSIKNDISNMLCMAVTGGSHVKRKLYSDSTMIIYSFRRCIVFNGVVWLSSQPDLLDRAMIFTLNRISDKDRKTDAEVYSNFQKDLPYILGGIFKALSKAMLIQPNLEVKNLPRLADFGLWGYAIAEALEIGGEEFFRIYKENQNNITLEILMSNPVAYALFEFMEKRHCHKCSMEQLHIELCDIADKKKINVNDPMWAKSPSSLSRRLNQLKVNLESEKIFFDVTNTGRHKEITIINKNLKPKEVADKKIKKTKDKSKSIKIKRKKLVEQSDDIGAALNE